MNSFKNKLKILVRNLNYFISLYIKNEYPKKNILKSRLNIIKLSNNVKFQNDCNDNLLLSADYHKVTKSRYHEFVKTIQYFEDTKVYFSSHRNRDNYMKKFWGDHYIFDVYSNCIFHQAKSDIFRYCFVYDNGGYWMDFKSSINFNINDLISDNQEALFVIGPELIREEDRNKFEKKELEILDNRYLINWFFWAKSKNQIFLDLINKISEDSELYKNKVFSDPKHAILNLTGPIQISKVVTNYLISNENKPTNLKLINESDYDFIYTTEYSRNFTIFDNVTKKHYSQMKNSKIFR